MAKYEVVDVDRYPDFVLCKPISDNESPCANYIELSDEDHAKYQEAVKQYDYWQDKIKNMMEEDDK